MGLRFWKKLGGGSIFKIMGESAKRTRPWFLLDVVIAAQVP